MPRFVLKAGIIEAVQYRGDNITEVLYFFDKDKSSKTKPQEVNGAYTVQLFSPVIGEYKRPLQEGDYIVRHVDGHYEVMGERAFKSGYERVNTG